MNKNKKNVLTVKNLYNIVNKKRSDTKLTQTRLERGRQRKGDGKK